MQWAAVMINLGQIIVPPQKGRDCPFLTKPTCQGMAWGSVESPPTILFPISSPQAEQYHVKVLHNEIIVYIQLLIRPETITALHFSRRGHVAIP